MSSRYDTIASTLITIQMQISTQVLFALNFHLFSFSARAYYRSAAAAATGDAARGKMRNALGMVKESVCVPKTPMNDKSTKLNDTQVLSNTPAASNNKKWK